MFCLIFQALFYLFVWWVGWLLLSVCGFETGAHYGAIAGLDFLVDHAGLEFRDPAASTSWAPGFRGRCTRPHFHFNFSEIRSLTETAAHQFGEVWLARGHQGICLFSVLPSKTSVYWLLIAGLVSYLSSGRGVLTLSSMHVANWAISPAN